MPRELIYRMLRLHEGVKPMPYQCTAGRWTIGVGRNFQDNPFTEDERKMLGNIPVSFSSQKNYLFGHFLTDAQITALLVSTVEAIMLDMAEDANILLASARASEVRKAVLVDMACNLGVPGLSKFKKMLAAMQVLDYDTAAAQMTNSRWFRQVGHRSRRLVEMMKTGVVPKELA